MGEGKIREVDGIRSGSGSRRTAHKPDFHACPRWNPEGPATGYHASCYRRSKDEQDTLYVGNSYSRISLYGLYYTILYYTCMLKKRTWEEPVVVQIPHDGQRLVRGLISRVAGYNLSM